MADTLTFKAVPFPFLDWVQESYVKGFQQTFHLARDWTDHIQLPPPPDASSCEWECRAVFAAKGEREKRRADILKQASYMGMVVSVAAPLFPASADPEVELQKFPKTLKMIQDALYDQESGVFRFKAFFNRGRPHHCCNLDIDPMFKKGDPPYPGHPAYPSGHSTQAHTVALLLGQLVPAKKQELLDAAYGVARNREVGGFHYGSDTFAGQVLAEQFVPLIQRVATFQAVVAAAAAEWPVV